MITIEVQELIKLESEISEYVSNLKDNTFIKLLHCFIENDNIPEYCRKDILHFTIEFCKYEENSKFTRFMKVILRQEFFDRYDFVLK